MLELPRSFLVLRVSVKHFFRFPYVFSEVIRQRTYLLKCIETITSHVHLETHLGILLIEMVVPAIVGLLMTTSLKDEWLRKKLKQ